MNLELTITNGYAFEVAIKTSKGGGVPPGKSDTITIKEDTILEVPGMGEIVILDVTNCGWNYPVHGDSGALIRYKSTEGYYRYDKTGALTMDFGFAGDCELSATSGELVGIKLPEMEVNCNMPAHTP